MFKDQSDISGFLLIRLAAPEIYQSINLVCKDGCPTYVYEVALAVQHEVAVVPILDLQQEADDAVASHADDEVTARLQKQQQ